MGFAKPISNTSGSGEETEQGHLRFPYSDILGNRDLETTWQVFLLKATMAFTVGHAVPVCARQQWGTGRRLFGHHIVRPSLYT